MMRTTPIWLAAAAAALVLVSPASAQLVEEQETVATEDDLAVGEVGEEIQEAAAVDAAEGAEAGPWTPPAPSPEEMDWIMMSSGEWLKGSLQRVVDGTVYFDSDEFDDIEVDWADVAELRSPRPHTYRFTGRRIATGTAIMKDGQILIAADAGVQTFEQGKLVTMMEGEPKEINYWSGKVSLGLAARSGNTNQLDLTAFARITRRTSLTRAEAVYNGAYSTFDSDETANSHRVSGTFDVYMTRRFFFTLPAAEFFVDPFQNLDLRATAGAGIGYEIYDGKYAMVETSVLGLYQYTAFKSVEVGRDDTANDAGVGLALTLELDLTSDLEWDTNYKTQLVVTDFNKTSQNLVTILSVDILGPIELDTTFNWDWVNAPEPRADGTVPKSSDYRISVGFGVDF
jgi:putative salt-induced outer membrane protein YdiY